MEIGTFFKEAWELILKYLLIFLNLFKNIYFTLIFSYTILILIYSIWLYKKLSVYYRKVYIINENKEEKIEIGESLYPEFKIDDSLSFFRIFIGNYLMLIIKGSIDIILALIQNCQLKSNMKNLKFETEENDWQKMKKTIAGMTSWLFFFNGISLYKKDLPYEEIYKKYLGPEYSFDPNEKYSLIISNHIGFYEVVAQMILNSAGFLAKNAVSNYCFVGPIAKGINCLFVKRENKENREKIFELLEERQRDFYEGKIKTPLCLFPEGTTTNGRYILKFKRGAFYALLPIKPQIILLNKNENMSLAVGVGSVAFHYLRSLCYFRHYMYYVDLPVIKPTEFMWENYKHFGNEKWEIYAEVTRKIMCEISGLKESDKNFRDSQKYEKSLIDNMYKEELLDC
jgi:1-acyl-sn-glycerol-3-phosphate acyltransferase